MINLRRAFFLGIAAIPALILLFPGLIAGDSFPGLPSAGVYFRLHSWWTQAFGSLRMGFPSLIEAPAPELLAQLLAPLVRAIGVVPVLKSTMLLDFGLSLGVGALWLRKEEEWVRAAALAALLASPALIAGLAVGDPEALRLWVALLPGLALGPWGLLLGAVGGLLAPGMLPAALVFGGLRLREKGVEPWTIGAMVVMALAAFWVGMPGRVAPSPSWFYKVDLGPDPVEVTAIYLGYLIPALIALAFWGGERRVAGAALITFTAAALRMPLVPAHLLSFVPMLALLAAGRVIQQRLPNWAPAVLVLVGGAVVGEGWKGSAVPVPLPTADLSIPSPVLQIPKGPVLDLPPTEAAGGRSLWLQTVHRQPVAAMPSRMMNGQADNVASVLGGGGCPSLAPLGFRSLLVRREQGFRELDKVVACLGYPTVDDGRVALWLLGD